MPFDGNAAELKSNAGSGYPPPPCNRPNNSGGEGSNDGRQSFFRRYANSIICATVWGSAAYYTSTLTYIAWGFAAAAATSTVISGIADFRRPADEQQKFDDHVYNSMRASLRALGPITAGLMLTAIIRPQALNAIAPPSYPPSYNETLLRPSFTAINQTPKFDP